MKLAPLLVTLLASTTLAYADESASRLHLDVEIDPTAYVFSGWSVHAGVGWKNARLDLGTYAMDIPELLHGNAGWNASFYGAGAKLQYFPLAEQHELFVDVSTGVSRQEVELLETGGSAAQTSFGFGIDAGWRFSLPYHFYATPWAGVSYSLATPDMMVDGKQFKMSPWTPFAAVHLGYRFR